MCSTLLNILVLFALLTFGLLENVQTTNSTTITTHDATPFTGRIFVKEVQQPHHLFIGRCTKKYPVVHQENVIFANDGKSHTSATIRVVVEGPVNITCVNIFDEDPEASAYPSYEAGGVGYNFVEFNVDMVYGKGFKVFVQIFGDYIAD